MSSVKRPRNGGKPKKPKSQRRLVLDALQDTITLTQIARAIYRGASAERYTNALLVMEELWRDLVGKDSGHLAEMARSATARTMVTEDERDNLEATTTEDERDNLEATTTEDERDNLEAKMMVATLPNGRNREHVAARLMLLLLPMLHGNLDAQLASCETYARLFTQRIAWDEALQPVRCDIERPPGGRRISPFSIRSRGTVDRVAKVFQRVLINNSGASAEDLAEKLVVHGLKALGLSDRRARSMFESQAVRTKRRAQKQP